MWSYYAYANPSMFEEQSFHEQGSGADFTGVIQCVRQRVPKFNSEFINNCYLILVLSVYNSISCDMLFSNIILSLRSLMYKQLL